MKCKECKAKLVTTNTYSLNNGNSIKRRKVCPECKIVYFTKEKIYKNIKKVIHI